MRQGLLGGEEAGALEVENLFLAKASLGYLFSEGNCRTWFVVEFRQRYLLQSQLHSHRAVRFMVATG
jgi:hypothetical protein